MKKIIDWARQVLDRRSGRRPSFPFAQLFKKFQEILEMNNRVLELIATANDKLGGDYIFDQQYINSTCKEVSDLTQKLVYNLDSIAPKKYFALHDSFQRIHNDIQNDLEGGTSCQLKEFTIFYDKIGHDCSEALGGKNANLAEVHTFLGLPVPLGFAITTAAFHAFMEHNKLKGQIETTTVEWLQDKVTTAAASEKIRDLIMNASLPGYVEKDMKNALEKLSRKTPNRDLHLAVRSSAWGEDGTYTFAGQYLTRLNVKPADLADCYRELLASTYNENAMEYRRQHGFSEKEVAMAVACQEMVESTASGVLYTLDPVAPEQENMIINATWGLGAPVVSGKAHSDQFTVDRRPPHRIIEVKVVRKEKGLNPAIKGGTSFQPVSKDLQTSSCLTNEQVAAIAEIGILIEKYFRKPQDIEFAINQEGKVIILQARQLAVKPHSQPRAGELAKILKKYPIVFRDQGEIAQRGIASGKVYHVATEKDLDNFPFGAILVAKYASPILARVLMKASGVITDVGSATGHMATIAREFRIPSILNTGIATKHLSEGREITIDADENIIYLGTVKELRYYSLAEEPIEETFEYRLLRRVLKKIAPLNLLDPTEKNFVPGACQTMHDITRFVHEKSVEELINLNYYHHHDPETVAGKLDWNIPLDLVMIDIGGGLLHEEVSKFVKPEQILSAPMQAILHGLSHPGAWNNEPMSVDFGSFMSSLTRTFPAELSSPHQVGQNLAVVSKEYANVSLRLGYHFTMIDAYLSENINNNYAYFRFFGGVTETTRRSRRAKFLGEVLANYDFRVELHGDLVVARVKKIDAESMKQRLYLLGLLVGFTRQLDVLMTDDRSIAEHVEKFNNLLEMKNES